MKKLLGVSALAMVLAACSSSNDRPQPLHGGPQGGNPQVEAALKACHESVGQTQDQAKFDACMKEKGFEKPAAQPQQAAEQTTAQAQEEAKTTTSTAKKAVKKATKKVVKKAVSK